MTDQKQSNPAASNIRSKASTPPSSPDAFVLKTGAMPTPLDNPWTLKEEMEELEARYQYLLDKDD